MRLFFKEIFFDRELVRHIKEVRVNEAHLYFQLISGRLTLKEYLSAL